MASRPPKATLLKSALKKTDKPFTYENDFFDRFHKKEKLCTIPATNKKHKKDVFLGMRPKPGIYADYDISQTDIKMDAGPTKIHLERTIAEYTPPPPGVDITPPPPPKKKKIKYSHGGPPVWEFIDEKRNKKIEELQQFYKQRLVELIARNKKADRAKRLAIHRCLLQLAGPEWYQELSPRQINTVNQLKDCIKKDLKGKDTINCFENLSCLGLVPRPNQRHIDAALQICCACPVEFLLILYQLMNPTRDSYSINDRIMLSAVVHLTMTETLRELHIRIPSPPPPPPPVSVKKKRPPKKKTYRSPYLIPFDFKPEPPKHSGIYKDNHRQYPESPYFSYIEALKSSIEYDEKENDGCSTSVEYGRVDYENNETEEPEENIEFARADDNVKDSVEVNFSDDSILKAEAEISKELVVAQKEYSGLTTHRPVPRLHKPSVYIPCKQGRMMEKVKEVEEPPPPPSEHDINVAVEVKMTTKYDECSGKMVQKVCECTVKFKDKRLIEETPKIEEIMPARDRGDSNVRTDDKNEGQTEVGENEETETTYEPAEPVQLPDLPEIDAGKNVTITRKPSPRCKCKYLVQKKLKTQSCNCEKCQELMKQPPTFIVSGLAQTEDQETVPVIEGVKDLTCDCMPSYKRRIKKYEEYKTRHDMVEQMRSLSQKFIISGVTIGPRGKPVFTISGVKPNCRCLEEQRKQQQVTEPEPLIKLKEMASSRCTCKPEVQKTIDEGVCRCKRCVELAHSRFKHDFIISGHREAEGDATERIIGGIKAHKTECECLKMYRKSVEQYESWKMRNQVVEKLKTTEQKYVIGGVVNRPNQPPVFIISGTEPKIECPCVQRFKEEEAERERLQKMPKKLLGLNYLISGVKETPEGNVYVISGVQEGGKKCKCLRLYDAFMKRHKRCLKVSEVYDEKIKEDLEEHMSELAEGEELEMEEEETQEDGEEVTEEQEEEAASNGMDESANMECGSACKEGVVNKQPQNDCNCGKEKFKEMDTKLAVKLEFNKRQPEEVCVCGETEEEKEEDVELKRFIILDKFPKCKKSQYNILKKALSVMAEDGYPLAKLPDCHKLPHFKLWLKLRSGISWSLEDKALFIKKYNKPCWNHTSKCFGKVSAGLVDIDPKMHREFSYANAKAVKKMVSTKRGYFYRVLKQSAIHDAREFIPTMNIYEFPFCTFRDCLFAYLPGKEEEVFSFRPWFPHEFKNMKDTKTC